MGLLRYWEPSRRRGVGEWFLFVQLLDQRFESGLLFNIARACVLWLRVVRSCSTGKRQERIHQNGIGSWRPGSWCRRLCLPLLPTLGREEVLESRASLGLGWRPVVPSSFDGIHPLSTGRRACEVGKELVRAHLYSWCRLDFRLLRFKCITTAGIQTTQGSSGRGSAALACFHTLHELLQVCFRVALGAFVGRLVEPLRFTLLTMIAIPSTIVIAIFGLISLIAVSPTLAPVEALAG